VSGISSIEGIRGARSVSVMGSPAIDCRDLVVRYGALVAVDGLSLVAERGKVLALLGPNGAGKTSTVETLEGYRRAAGGTVRVLGYDPRTDHTSLVPHIGVMLQRGGVYPTMPARRVLELFAGFYTEPEDVDQLLDLVGLTAVARTPWKRLSGGEQQRLSLALALVGRPEVLFLDEPTAGVDPEGRLAIREVIATQRRRGVCILLTTHELPEAERLADEVVIAAHGRALARGTVAELAARAGKPGIDFSAPEDIDVQALAGVLDVEVSAIRQVGTGRYAVKAPATAARLASLAGWLEERKLPVSDLSAGHRSLEDVYLELTRSASSPETLAETAADTDSGLGTEANGTRAVDIGAEAPAVAEAETPRSHGAVVTSSRSPSAAKRLLVQARAELGMTLRRGESLLLTIGIPVILLVFFSEVHVLPVGGSHPITFLAPGILALAIMSTAMVNLSIATGFERSYGVLKRLGSTPLGRPCLLGAKTVAILATELLQVVVLVLVALALGWHPTAAGTGAAVAITLIATVAFAGIGLLLAGTLRGEVNLAASNGLWLLLLLVSGMLAPLSKLPGWLEGVAKALPAAALAQGLHSSLGLGRAVPASAWLVLAIWAVGAPVAAAASFKWE
jgi:ABC-2 type transport system ATP-binding protein